MVLDKRYLSLALFSILFISILAAMPDQVNALPSITVSPTSGPPGSTVTVTGSGFPINTATSIIFLGEYKQTTTNAQGAFSESIIIPLTANQGSTITITADAGGPIATAQFAVTSAQPLITLTPTTGTANTSVTVKGIFFGASKTITLKLDNNPITPTQGTITANNTGGFTATITIPTGTTAGPHTVSAADNSQPALTASATFTVVSSAITLSSTSGPVNTVVTITGVNFAPSTAITIKLDQTNITPIGGLVTSSPQGGFTASITIPTNAQPGARTISASDGVKTETATFTVVTAAITLSPISGIAGSTTSVTGTGFAPTSSITIKFDTTTLSLSPSVTSNTAGGFTATVSIPNNASPSAHIITAIDTTSRNATATFTVLVSGTVTLSPVAGNRGTSVTVTGSGFNADSAITMKFDGASLPTTPTTVTTSASGQFTATITIPLTASAGAHTISATDASGRSGIATMTVAAGGSITITPTVGVTGIEVTLTGSNFTINTRVTVKFDSISVATLPSAVYASNTGTILAKFDVPAGIESGTHIIIATDDSGKVGTATFTVQGTGTSITLSPTGGPPGTIVTVTATNFAPNTAATVKIDNTVTVTNPSSVITNSNGGFTVTITVPNISAGSHPIAVTVGSATATATFTITSGSQGPTITLSPTAGTGGSSVTVTGSGFLPSKGITVNLDGSMVAVETTSASGIFTVLFTIPPAITPGSHTVTANDGSSTATATLSIGGGSNILNVSQLRLVDQTGATISDPSQGMQVLIQSDLRNSLSTDQQFAYIVQLKDSNGSTIMISWMTGTLPAGKQYAVAQSWLAEENGNYEVEVFVWQSVSNPVVLAPVSKTTITVA